VYCRNLGIPMNPYHVHADMGFEYMLKQLDKLTGISYELLFNSNCEVDYNVVMVMKIHKQ
jgi:hypothetical protein